MASTKRCPHCNQVVPVVNDGSGPGVDERGSPWIFIAHQFNDPRDEGYTVRLDCPAGGYNEYTARTSC